MSDAAPQHLRNGRYTLADVLGRGGMASVYRAWDHRLAVWRAVKLLKPELASRRKLRDRFEAEGRTMAALEHPNVVRILDVGDEGEVPWLLMELLEGGSPADWLSAHGPMPPRLACEVVQQLCAGVGAAHARGFIHRDLKPHNLLISSDGVVKVTDFGIAQVRAEDLASELTRTGSMMGTVGFMAPEQRLDAKSVDHRADVYAAGATLFTLLTNRVAIELFAADRAPSILQGVPSRLVPVVLKACRLERDQRYPTLEALAADLRKLAVTLPPVPADTPPLARPPTPHPAPPKPETGAATATMPAPAAPLSEPTIAATPEGATELQQGLVPGVRSWKRWDGQADPGEVPEHLLFAGPRSPTQLHPPKPPPPPEPLVGPPADVVSVPEPRTVDLVVHLECDPKRRLGHGKPFDAVPVIQEGLCARRRLPALVAAAAELGHPPNTIAIRAHRDDRAWSQRELWDAAERLRGPAADCAGCPASARPEAYGCFVSLPRPIPSAVEHWLAERWMTSDHACGQVGLDWLSAWKISGRAMRRLRSSGGWFESDTPYEKVVTPRWWMSKRVDTDQILEGILLPDTFALAPERCLPPLLALGALAVDGRDPEALTAADLGGLGGLAPGEARLAAATFVATADAPELAPAVALLQALWRAWANDVRLLVGT